MSLNPRHPVTGNLMWALPFGYCYTLRAPAWARVDSEAWDTELADHETEDATLVGFRAIDGTRCAVFSCRDGAFRAVTLAAARVRGAA